jgi:malate synthase
MNAVPSLPDRIALRAALKPGHEQVLTSEALHFLADLARRFTSPVLDLLTLRRIRQAQFDRGERPAFLAETRDVREASWTVGALPDDLLDRRVEITGPTDRKMVINGLNSGANVFMADFEDANTPAWDNLIQGQVNLMDAVRRTIRFIAPETGKAYELSERPATLFVRPRGLHLPEKHIAFDGRPMPGALFDFGLYFFHNADALRRAGTGPYFYLAKLESHLEARLWNDVFHYAQDALGVAAGTIKATVLIETLPAAFEMDEILFELKEHSAGLNSGRWDYIFSFIKKLRNDPAAVLPDRAEVTMDKGFLRAYDELIIKTCHRRGVHAMGGMAAQIPIKGDPEANEEALAKVRADKLREVTAGHDGTWVAHPALVSLARAVFDEHMKGQNQIAKRRDDVRVEAADLLAAPAGPKTEGGLCHNLRVGILYLESWLRGVGSVPLFNLMEDAATAEISRAQVWQWMRHGARLDSGEVLTKARVRSLLRQEADAHLDGKRKGRAPGLPRRGERSVRTAVHRRRVRGVSHSWGVRENLGARSMSAVV